MNVHRFTATNNQKALALIQDAFGPEALIYSTRSIENGVEILAGPPHSIEPVIVKPDTLSGDIALIEKLHAQINTLTENVNKLSAQVNQQMQDDMYYQDDELAIKRSLLTYHLTKLGFRGKFVQQFNHNYLRSKKFAAAINEENVAASLLKYIRTSDVELTDEPQIYAFVGPTGVGKTTTIMKLVKRYLAKADVKSLGLITTDYNDIAARNQLLNFSRLHKIDLEFANDESELAMVLAAMQHKKLILIDTHGISQRDHQTVNDLLTLLESQGDKIATYMILPCNVQEPILDEIARAFTTKTLKACILTKQDECISTAPALSVSISYKMKISYICNGQNIDKDIELAKADKILQQIISESLRQKRITEVNLSKNLERVHKHTTSDMRLG